MTQPLDERYFVWLYGQVAEVDEVDNTRTYWKLLRILYSKEFEWKVPNDDNRIEDGKDLRIEFIHDQDLVEVDTAWIELGCSIFELIVGLSRKLVNEADETARHWFWILLDNLGGFSQYNDSRRIPRTRIERIIERLIDRDYGYDGAGGLFPLTHPREDQREVELWYQLNNYAMEL